MRLSRSNADAWKYAWTYVGRSALLAIVLAVSVPASSARAKSVVNFVPHRAVYDLELARAASVAGITSLSGRLVFEFGGNACVGYTQSWRMFTRLVNRRGERVDSDMRSTSWEKAGAERFRFNSTTLQNGKKTSVIKGDAARSGSGDVTVTFESPQPGEKSLAGKIVFPVQHSIGLLRAARAGERIYQADLYDGTDKGLTVYSTTTVIGNPMESAAGDLAIPATKAAHFKGLKAWPISIAFYKGAKVSGDVTPDYQLSMRFFENGVSTKLMYDYGSFAIRGRLSKIDFLKPLPCDKSE